jgi:hypothetical protein
MEYDFPNIPVFQQSIIPINFERSAKGRGQANFSFHRASPKGDMKKMPTDYTEVFFIYKR